MPKYRPDTEKAIVKKLTKSYIQSGFNQSRMAEKEGVTSQAINQRLARKPVRDALQEYLDSEKLKQKLAEVAQEGLQANKVISCNVIAPNGEEMADAHGTTKDFIDVPDHNARHKFWHDLMIIGGKLKTNGKDIVIPGNGNGHRLIIIRESNGHNIQANNEADSRL